VKGIDVMTTSAATFEQAYRGFSCPQEGLDEPLFSTIAVEYARGVADRFLSTYRAHLTEFSSGLVEFLDSWLETAIDFSQAWSPIYGQLGEILAGRSPLTPGPATIRLALAVHEHGIPGEWDASLSSVTSFRFARWVLPKAMHFHVQGDRSRVIIETRVNGDAPQQYVFTSDGSRWSAPNELTSYPELPMERNRLMFLLLEPLYSPEFSFLQEELLPESAWPGLPARYDESFHILRSAVPEYLTWVDRTMRNIIPLRGGDAGTITSGSTKGDPGTCHMCSGNNALALAEMLVHEATHQYYHVLTRVAPVHDGSDTNLYYSPIKRRGRPIQYILLAYHAFANVLLFTRACLQNGVADPEAYLSANEAELLPQLMQLEDALKETRALTPVGLSLWHPLSERVHGER
jgi:HEXXH motif-containing protein